VKPVGGQADTTPWALPSPFDGSAIEANPGYFVGEPRGPRL